MTYKRRNFETWDHGGLSVPLNEKGQKEYENWIEDTPDIYWDILYSEDYYALEHVFWEWNDEFDLLIDMYEDYGFAEPMLSRGVVSIPIEEGSLREGETYCIAAIGYEGGEINFISAHLHRVLPHKALPCQLCQPV